MIPSGRKPDHFSVDFRAQMGIMDGIEAKECRRGPLRDARGGILKVDEVIVKTMGYYFGFFVVKLMGYYFVLS